MAEGQSAKIRVLITATHGDKSARIFEIRVYESLKENSNQ